MLNRTLKKLVLVLYLALIEKEKGRSRERDTHRQTERDREREEEKKRLIKNNLLSKRFFFTAKQSVILGIIRRPTAPTNTKQVHLGSFCFAETLKEVSEYNQTLLFGPC